MAETFSILMPTGLVMDVGVIAPVNGIGNYGPVVVAPVMPGIRVSGTGEFSVSRLSGRRGTMRVSLVTGTAGGTGQAVVALSVLGTSLYLGLMLNTSNKPVAIIRDQYGTPIAESAPLTGSAIAAGTPIEVVFAWDATGVVAQGLLAGVLITLGTDTRVPEWTIAPTATWATYTPDVMYVGMAPPGFALVPFTGTIEIVQVSDEVEFAVPTSATVTEDLNGSALMAGVASMTANATVAYAAEAAIEGDSTITADGDVTTP